MRRSGTLFFFGALVVVTIGCNSILENEPGRLDRGASVGRNGGGAEAAPIRGDNEPDAANSSGSTSGTSSGGGEGSSGAVCSPALKACGDLCVSTADPSYGCASPVCAPCPVPNATAACVLGACGVGACTPGFADCNALPADGCETSLQTVNDCGACGLQCPALKNADMACVGGACTGTCLPGFGDCNGKTEDGCEKNLLKDRNNCGACGAHCMFGRCEQGLCVWGDDDD